MRNIKFNKLITVILTVLIAMACAANISAETIGGENVREWDSNGIPYSDWTLIPSGYDGEKSKLQYSTSDFLGYELTQTKESGDSKEVVVYYEDSEYIVLNNKKWLSTYASDPSPIATNRKLVAYVKDDDASNWTTPLKDEYTAVKVIANNKWGLKTAGKSSGDSYISGYDFSINNSSYSSNDRNGNVYTNTVNFTPMNDNPSYSVYEDPTRVVYLQTIMGFGIEAGDIGWGYRIKTDGGQFVSGIETEYNEYNSTGIYSSGEDSNWEGQCMSTGAYKSSYGYGGNVCYDTRIGNKTLSTTAFITGTVTDLSGNRFNIEGFTGNHYISLFSRSYSYKATKAGATYLSVIERIYYMDYTGASHPNTVSKFYAKPKWSAWSGWIDVPEGQSAPSNSSTQKVQTRTLYSHPLTYTVNYHKNGGTGEDLQSTLCIYANACTTRNSGLNKKGYINAGWSFTSTSSAYIPDGGQINSSDANIKNHIVSNALLLYANWVPVTYTISFNANGGDNAPGAVTKTYDTPLTLPSNIPNRDGFEFVGWAKSKTAIKADYNAGSTIASDLSSKQGDNIVLYAVWKSKAYVTFTASDVYIKRNTDSADALNFARSSQSVLDINYGISKDDIYIKELKYQDGTKVSYPSGVDTSKIQKIYATYGIIAADNTEKTSSAYIYIVDSAVDVSPDDIDDPKIFARYVDCNMAGFGIYYSDSIYKNDLEYAKYLEEVCKVDNTDVEKSITVKRN